MFAAKTIPKLQQSRHFFLAPLLRSSWWWWQSWKWRRTCASHMQKTGKPVNQPNNTKNKTAPQKSQTETKQTNNQNTGDPYEGETVKQTWLSVSEAPGSEHLLRQIVPLNTRMCCSPHSNVFQSTSSNHGTIFFGCKLLGYVSRTVRPSKTKSTRNGFVQNREKHKMFTIIGQNNERIEQTNSETNESSEKECLRDERAIPDNNHGFFLYEWKHSEKIKEKDC